MKIRFVNFFIAVSVFATSFAQPAAAQAVEKWDLKKCIEYALENNISIKQQDIQAMIAQLTYKQSKSSQFPSLNLGSNLGISTGRSIDRTTNQFTTQSVFYNSFSLQSNVDVFNWFSKRNTIAGNQFELQASMAGVDKLKNDISLNIAAAYLQTLLAKEQVHASRIQIGQDSAQLENTKKLVQAGSLPELNQVQLESQLATDSFTLVSAQGTEMQSLLLIKSLLNLDAGTPFDIVIPLIGMIPIDPIAELQPEFVYALAIKNLPQQRVNQLRLLAAQKYADAAKGSMYPSIGLGASLGTNYSNSKNNANRFLFPNQIDTIAFVGTVGSTPVVIPKSGATFFSDPYSRQISDNLNTGVGLNITVPIFNGRSARTNWEKQKLNVRSLSLQQDLDNMTLKQDIYSAYTDAMTALQKFNTSSRAVVAAQKAYDFSKKRYEVGLLNTIELLISQNSLFTATINRLSAQYDYVFKMKVLEFYKGEGLKL
jgi:outer membrane protein